MKISGWGQHPIIDSSTTFLTGQRQIEKLLTGNEFIPRGLGRSYGDSSLAESNLNTTKYDHFIDFNPKTGVLTCEAGVSFADILKFFIPKGWFLPVTPGTQFVTVGGAIASDVHGKNHHLDGSFSDHLLDLTLALANGEVLTCSKRKNKGLFLATCGGMGLTGIILQARIKLLKINTSYIDEVTYKTHNLKETLDRFETHHDATYSVAWIDCLAKGDALGRSLLMLGEHLATVPLTVHRYEVEDHSKLNIPFHFPSFTLNQYSIKAFNALYYGRIRHAASKRTVNYAPFFYPLDSIQNWNRLYGKNGFVQYQFVIPKAAGYEGLKRILEAISDSQKGSFLAVLKVFGKGNENYLSFPIEGYTLALDFKMDSNLLPFLELLDKIVLEYGGRIYLTKDARMSQSTFKQSYPNWEMLQEIREQTGADKLFNSLQSKRLGL